MNKFTTPFSPIVYVQVRCHLFVILSCLVLAWFGHVPESSGGWVLQAAEYRYLVVNLSAAGNHHRGQKQKRSRRNLRRNGQLPARVMGQLVFRQTRRGLGWRTLLLLGCWWGDQIAWLATIPWLLWGWQLLGVVWPGWCRQPEWQMAAWLGKQAERTLLVFGLFYLFTEQIPEATLRLLQHASVEQSALFGLGALGCVLCGGTESKVKLGTAVDEQEEVSHYKATLCGHFEVAVGADDFFRRRLLILFLRLLDVPGESRHSRRTKDGRTPTVRQQALALPLVSLNQKSAAGKAIGAKRTGDACLAGGRQMY